MFTLSTAWTTTPSASALFVVEQNNDLLLWTHAVTTTYAYHAGGFSPDAPWSTASVNGGSALQYPVAPVAMGAGCMAESCFSIVPDTALNARQSHVIYFPGAGLAAMYYLDVAALAWSAAQTFGYAGPVF